MSTDRKLNIICWSGGKDSTATIVLAHELGIPIDLIIISLIWFDKKTGHIRRISRGNRVDI